MTSSRMGYPGNSAMPNLGSCCVAGSRARTSGPMTDQRREQQRDLDVIDDAVAGRGARERGPELAVRSRAPTPGRGWRRRPRSPHPRQSPAPRPRRRARGRSRRPARAPSRRSACRPRTGRRRSRSGRRRSGTSSGDIERRGEDHGRERDQPSERAEAATRYGSAPGRAGAPRSQSRISAPAASSAVSAVVAPTVRCRISPP